jgi:hypothetical protein
MGRGERERVARAPSASLFGELRGGFADYLWMKADRLFHNGVELRSLTNAEERDARRQRVEHDHDAHAGHEEEAGGSHVCSEGATTVVPNREADRRGILGDLERQVKPYMDIRSHKHRDPSDTAALFRLMTWANPRFIPGWVVGADVLAGRMGRPKEALAFLTEGAAQNPESVEIQVEIGRYQMYRFRDGAAAEERFRRAIALGAAQRELPAAETEAWEHAHRWLFIRCHRAGRQREAREIARAALRRFPESRYFQRAIHRPGL